MTPISCSSSAVSVVRNSDAPHSYAPGFSARRKTLKNLFGTLALFTSLISAPSLVAQHHHHGAEGGDANAAIEKFGAVKMPISCAASVQAPFERGIALLHSFWYEEAVKQFKAVAVADPHCAMAQWALAMTEPRPFWDGLPDERRKAGIAEIDKATSLKPKTDREQRYIAALSGYLHASPSDGKAALQSYDDKMAALHTAYPEDVEATAFYGLALATSVIDTQDIVGDGRRALSVLEPGFQAHPDHPGFAHYIIHTCDNPQLAREALPAAERYAAIAPSSAHALHMPGHIFARLGMWPEDVTSNVASVHASEYAEKNHLGGVTHEAHAYEFLLYAYLQQADDAEAKRILDMTEPMAAHLRAPEFATDGMAPYITYFQVEFPSIYYLEIHDWQAVLAIPEPANSITSTKYYRYWAQAIAAGHLRDADAADKAAAAAQQFSEAAQKEGSPIGAEMVATLGTVKAWQSFAHKNDDQALQQISAAADIQDRVGQAEVDIPAREMYGDMLMLEDRPGEALVQYRTALQLSPNRLNALANAGRAAEASGRPDEAATYYTQLLKITAGGTKTQRPEVAHAHEFINRQEALL
ncbi:tetratricopeptide repeat protein [Terriglobus saanensis]|uniref:TPR repeat-containing protein n=1 Tax=Terriglobus saanensis (strain ATCC BAA-1853 / DSM 23119 / SP1PR4) TaxID=401053 RepID=E8V5B7_TERSS|nr:tetratricopeptide repeat protein [Terriglobus saanensis]ADV84876.1 TPR repeat-containing protein [Terriglobus saanensis SP1PR4]